jgi:hypothetical protein
MAVVGNRLTLIADRADIRKLLKNQFKVVSWRCGR